MEIIRNYLAEHKVDNAMQDAKESNAVLSNVFEELIIPSHDEVFVLPRKISFQYVWDEQNDDADALYAFGDVDVLLSHVFLLA